MHFFNPSSKIACISDIHLGVHQNSSTWHTIALNFACWLKEVLHDRQIQNIVISGDVFHNRHEIGVSTLHTAYKFFDILKDFNIAVLTGNHDCYYKDKSDINSITILENSKVAVYQNIRTFTYKDRIVTFCPWGTSIDTIPKSDVIFGHFEITNFKMNQHKICDHGVATESLLDKAPLIISGHFHFRDHRKYSNNKSILYLGSPYELDFGDREQNKGISILDINTLEIEFIQNDITPKHIKLNLTDLKQTPVERLSSIISNNIVSLNLDKKIDMPTLEALQVKLMQYGPLQFRTEFNYTDGSIVDEQEVEKLSIDIETAMHEFVELLNVEVDKKIILEKCLDLYKATQKTNE